MNNKAGYIGIKEASKLVGVHPDTIRRLIKQHKGSSNIAQGKGPKAPYYINTDWLKSIYGLNEPHTAPTTGETKQDEPTTDPGINNAMSAVIEALTAQLQAKDQQLERAQATIDKMASDYSTLLNQSQQLQGLLLPKSTGQDYQNAKGSEEEPSHPIKEQQVYHKVKTPQSRVKNATKQAKRTKKTTKKQTAQKVDSPKPEKSQKKRWWMR